MHTIVRSRNSPNGEWFSLSKRSRAKPIIAVRRWTRMVVAARAPECIVSLLDPESTFPKSGRRASASIGVCVFTDANQRVQELEAERKTVLRVPR